MLWGVHAVLPPVQGAPCISGFLAHLFLGKSGVYPCGLDRDFRLYFTSILNFERIDSHVHRSD